MSLRRGQATQRKPAMKKAGNRQGYSSNGKQSNASVSRGQAKASGLGPLVQAPTAMSRRVQNSEPRVKSNGKSCTIAHRELLGSITGSSAFSVLSSYALNPGIAASFPWLSTSAQMWEKYRFKKLKYCYYPRTGTTTPGSFLMAPDYDAADSAPTNEQVASSYTGAVEDAPWKEISIVLDPRKLHEKGELKFVRTGTLANNLDIKTYDAGNHHIIAIDGTAVAWGKLWVEYEVEFETPQLPPSGPILISGGNVAGGGVQTGANPLGDVPVVDAQAVGLSASAASVVTIANVGTYLVSERITGTVITALGLSATSGCTVSATAGETINGAATEAQRSFIVVTSVPNATVTMTSTATTIVAAGVRFGIAPTSSLS